MTFMKSTPKGWHFCSKPKTIVGTWPAGEGGGPGLTGLAVLAFLASGDDPDFGPHRDVIRNGLRHIIGSQSAVTGYMGPSMYHHGFALLAVSEAYGVVDDTDLFSAQELKSKTESGGRDRARRAVGDDVAETQSPGLWRLTQRQRCRHVRLRCGHDGTAGRS